MKQNIDVLLGLQWGDEGKGTKSYFIRFSVKLANGFLYTNLTILRKIQIGQVIFVKPLTIYTKTL